MNSSVPESRGPRIRIRLPLEGFPRHAEEFVWAVSVEDEYRVMSAPFLSSACARGDRVTVSGDGVVRELSGVTRASGSTTHRFLFAASVSPEDELERLSTLTGYGATAEHASNRFYALDVSPESNRMAIQAQLGFWEKKGWLLYARDEPALDRLSHALADRPLIHWGFAEPPETPIVSVRKIVEDEAPIQHVVRGPEPPKFQLLGWATPTEDDACVTTLGSLVEQDPTLHDLADLPIGWHAWREASSDPWTTAVHAD